MEFNEAIQEYAEEKKRIARTAISLIGQNDSIIIASPSTIGLLEEKGVRVIIAE